MGASFQLKSLPLLFLLAVREAGHNESLTERDQGEGSIIAKPRPGQQFSAAADQEQGGVYKDQGKPGTPGTFRVLIHQVGEHQAHAQKRQPEVTSGSISGNLVVGLNIKYMGSN
ncbi:MAG: hypothetical protein WA110_08060 [Anaerolineaceae bacterium]